MRTSLIRAVADVICRAQKNGTVTSSGIAIALESAGLLQSPEVAADHARLAARVAALEAERHATNSALADLTVALRAAEARDLPAWVDTLGDELGEWLLDLAGAAIGVYRPEDTDEDTVAAVRAAFVAGRQRAADAAAEESAERLRGVLAPSTAEGGDL